MSTTRRNPQHFIEPRFVLSICHGKFHFDNSIVCYQFQMKNQNISFKISLSCRIDMFYPSYVYKTFGTSYGPFQNVEEYEFRSCTFKSAQMLKPKQPLFWKKKNYHTISGELVLSGIYPKYRIFGIT